MLALVPFASTGPEEFAMLIEPFRACAVMPAVAPCRVIVPFVARASTFTPAGSARRSDATTLVGLRLNKLNMSSHE